MKTLMKTHYVKELSRLTKVSIRTLHYYDKIGLLKPSDRHPNGYRVYSEKDLEKLEKIITLKFFGFTLARIKQLLANESVTLQLLETQLILLQSEISFLQEAQRNLLMASIQEYRKKSDINWHEVAELIADCTKASKEISFNARNSSPPSDSKSEVFSNQEIWQKLIAKIHSYDYENL